MTTRPVCPHKSSHCYCFWGPHNVASLRESKPASVDLCFGYLWWKSPELMANQESQASTNTKAKGEAKPGFSLQQSTAQSWNSGMHSTQPHRCIATSVIIQSLLTEMNTEPLLQDHQPRGKSKSRSFLGNECHGSGLCLSTDALMVLLSGFPDGQVFAQSQSLKQSRHKA